MARSEPGTGKLPTTPLTCHTFTPGRWVSKDSFARTTFSARVSSMSCQEQHGLLQSWPRRGCFPHPEMWSEHAGRQVAPQTRSTSAGSPLRAVRATGRPGLLAHCDRASALGGLSFGKAEAVSSTRHPCHHGASHTLSEGIASTQKHLQEAETAEGALGGHFSWLNAGAPSTLDKGQARSAGQDPPGQQCPPRPRSAL